MSREEAKKELSKLIFELGFEDNVDDKVYALNMAIQTLSQEPSRDMEEIAEIMECDADAETKCKMISYILTAKPHYFEEQEPIDEIAQKAYEDGKKDGYVQAKVEQEPCNDAVSRQAVLKQIFYSTDNDGDVVLDSTLRRRIENLPPVMQKSGKWIVHEKPHGIRYLECPYCNIWYLNEHLIRNSYCPNCGSYNGGDNN